MPVITEAGAVAKPRANQALSERARLNRQDQVDNQIHLLIETLSGRPVAWDMEIISEVRDAVAETFERHGIMSTEDFYPLAADEASEEADDEPPPSFAAALAAARANPVGTALEFGAFVLLLLIILYGFPLLSALFEH